MRKCFYILISLSLLAAVGCGRGVDRRLVLADTLMWTAPDSSLAILNAINRDSLQGDENRAYHALLLTQAQFRCNGNCTTDTIINSALDHYSDNHNREHYTRALLYKGAFYEERENPVEAMKWYKQAEDNADTTDYRNLAQINMRMGQLYYTNYAGNNLDLEKFEKAHYYYEKLNDMQMMMRSLLKAANVYRITDNKRANKYYQKAKKIAIELKDTANLYSILSSLSLKCMADTNFIKAKEYMLEALNLDSSMLENSDYYILSQAYACLGNMDSAIFYLKKPDASINTAYDSLMYLKGQTAIALAQKKYALVDVLTNTYLNLSDSLEHNKNKYLIKEYELEFDSKKKASIISTIYSQDNTIIILSCILLIVFFTLLIIILIRKRKHENLIKEVKAEDFMKYEQLKHDIQNLDNKFSNVLVSQIDAINKIMNEAYNNNTDIQSKDVLHNISPIDDFDTDFWNGLYTYINHRYDGLIDSISKQYPKLSPSDINFIGLMCCDFSDAAIAVCKGYRNTDSVRSRKNKIKNKMGINVLLAVYLRELKEKCSPIHNI